MRNLLRFILKNNFYFFFIFLQLCGIYLLYLSHSFQGTVLWNTSQHWLGEYYRARSSWLRYFFLKEINASLSQALLRAAQKNNICLVFPHDPSDKKFLPSSLFMFKKCEVVDEFRHYPGNYVTITGGKNHGIEKDMGVFSPLGIVGVVQDVSDNYSLVMSALHSKFRVHCELKKNGIYGMYEWDGGSPYYALITDLPNHTQAIRGDTIVTGKLSGIFPPGIPVGIIESVERRQNEPFLTARIRLTTEWGRLHHVFAVKNIHYREIDSLKKKPFYSKEQ